MTTEPRMQTKANADFEWWLLWAIIVFGCFFNACQNLEPRHRVEALEARCILEAK